MSGHQAQRRRRLTQHEHQRTCPLISFLLTYLTHLITSPHLPPYTASTPTHRPTYLGTHLIAHICPCIVRSTIDFFFFLLPFLRYYLVLIGLGFCRFLAVAYHTHHSAWRRLFVHTVSVGLELISPGFDLILSALYI
ncbi:hypothetical protein BJY01DRAFT_225461 [Aspergillus pseudoustus]|uniref:Uncharacterized protein n=1 Tax=Aspergillus pseudoustus TaxID=1810923 RepID=A0ABR4IZB8_9EURO